MFINEHSALIINALLTVAVVIIAYIVTRIIKSSLKDLAEGEVRKHFRKTVYRVFQIIVWLIAFFIILGIWGFSLTGLLAGAGFIGIVVGFAAQETLGNVISGLVLMFSRPFEIGDWIEIAGYSGIVEELSLIHTIIRTFDGEVVSVPNQIMSSKEIDNKSRAGKLRVEKTIGIDYESDSLKAKEIAEEEMNKHDFVLDDPEPKAMVDELGDSSVNIELLFWVDEPSPGKRRKALDDIIVSTKERYEEEGIGIPFPHMELIQHESEE